ncbi:hypothetical protein CWB41_00900 [Methylovirgula ligni]|nr:hypothetical protein CWB41_00900 [Methylovirgula ligni]
MVFCIWFQSRPPGALPVRENLHSYKHFNALKAIRQTQPDRHVKAATQGAPEAGILQSKNATSPRAAPAHVCVRLEPD